MDQPASKNPPRPDCLRGVHDDYCGIIDGRWYALFLDPETGATVLAPVDSERYPKANPDRFPARGLLDQPDRPGAAPPERSTP